MHTTLVSFSPKRSFAEMATELAVELSIINQYQTLHGYIQYLDIQVYFIRTTTV